MFIQYWGLREITVQYGVR